MGTRGMIDSIKFNDWQKSKRRKLYDPELKRIHSRFEEFTDHKKMKTFEFAEFQKELFQKVKKERFRQRLRIVLSIVLTILFLLSLPFLFSIIFN